MTDYPRGETADERVARGAALLDARHPGWHEEVDLDRLYMRSTCDCVLGQLYSPSAAEGTAYDNGLRALGEPDAPAHGFDSVFGERHRLGYPQLEAAWRRAILARREAG